MGMVLVTRLLHDQPPPEIMLGLAWLGGLMALVGGVGWAFHGDPVESRPMLMLGLAGMTICAGGLSPAGAAESYLSGRLCIDRADRRYGVLG